ncbi:MAG: hypothetical protein CMF74_18240 [Maricaulis sp.]|nr:hypothetical protein [Maricaulis sp.]
MYESLKEATKFHAANQENWCGEALAEYKHEVFGIIKERNIKSILDYGCGKAKFHNILFNNSKVPGSPTVSIVGYDPAFAQYSQKPTGDFDLILCVDVMEHVQEDKVDEVLSDIFNSYSGHVFMTITCYEATQVLLNGKNAHYTVKEPDWWKSKLQTYTDRCTVIFQTRPDRSKITINKEEWKPNKKTLDKLAVNHKTLDETQIEKAKLLND